MQLLNKSFCRPNCETGLYRGALWIVLLICLGFRLAQLAQGFWWDEFITYWVSSAPTLSEVFGRVSEYQGQGPLFFLIEWFLILIVSSNEIILRLPSVLALLVSLGLLFRFLKNNYCEETAIIGILFFLCNSALVEPLLWARPYSLALLFSLSCSLVLLNFLHLANWRHYSSYALAAVLGLFFHPISFVVIFGHIPIILCSKFSKRVQKLRWLLAVGSVGLAFLYISLEKNTSIGKDLSLYFGNPGFPWRSLLQAILVETLVVAAAVYFICSLLVAALSGSNRGVIFTSKGKSILTMAITLYFIPALALVFLCLVYGEGLFQSRYTIFFLPYSSILLAVVAGETKLVDSQKLATFLLACFVLYVCWTGISIGSTSWRKAIERARLIATSSDAKLLFSPGVSESNNPNWFREEQKTSYLLSPLKYYPIPVDTVLIPIALKNGELKEIALNRIKKVSNEAKSLVWIYGSYDDEETFYRNYNALLGIIESFDYSVSETTQFGRVITVSLSKLP